MYFSCNYYEMRKWSITFSFVFTAVIASAQVNIDSLKNVWNDVSIADSVRLNAINDLAWDGYLFSSPDSSLYFSRLEYEFAKESGNTLFMAKALNTQGASHWISGNLSKAISAYEQSLEILQKLGNKTAEAASLNNI